MNTEIEAIFKNFVVDSVDIPIGFIRYRGDKLTYLTYQSISNIPTLSGDDEIVYSVDTIDIDVYTPSNYLNIMIQVKKKMKEHGYIWTEDSQDFYEEDTKLYHKTMTFIKERMC